MNLQTQYLGLELKSPLVAAASPLSKTLDGMRRMEDAGASAIVLFSLFEEQIQGGKTLPDHFMESGTDPYEEARSFLPQSGAFGMGPDEYLHLIHAARQTLDIPIIASLNGVTDGGWIRYAKLIQEAGADALELNLYRVAADPGVQSVDVEREHLAIVRNVKGQITIPLSVKLSPYFTALANMVRGISLAGAQGVVLFNRFYEPDFDLENLEVVPKLEWSTSSDLRLPLHWTSMLYGRVSVDLALSGGIHTQEDVVKAIMAGAKVTTLASELLQNGVGRLRELERDLKTWMEEHDFPSVAKMRGTMSMLRVSDPGTFERASYMKELQSSKSTTV